MVIHYYSSSPTTSLEDTVLAAPGRRRSSLSAPLISYRFGHFGPGPTETDITVLSFRLQTEDGH